MSNASSMQDADYPQPFSSVAASTNLAHALEPDANDTNDTIDIWFRQASVRTTVGRRD